VVLFPSQEQNLVSSAQALTDSHEIVQGSCLTTSKTPAGTNRLMAGLMITISQTLNLLDRIGSSPFRAKISVLFKNTKLQSAGLSDLFIYT
jgi:hypothetical protein